jgi:hypothetical protein
MAVDGAGLAVGGVVGAGAGGWVAVTLTDGLSVVRDGDGATAGDGWRVRMGTADTGLSDAGATTTRRCVWDGDGRPFGGACDDDAGMTTGSGCAGLAGNTTPITVTVSQNTPAAAASTTTAPRPMRAASTTVTPPPGRPGRAAAMRPERRQRPRLPAASRHPG